MSGIRTLDRPAVAGRDRSPRAQSAPPAGTAADTADGSGRKRRWRSQPRRRAGPASGRAPPPASSWQPPSAPAWRPASSRAAVTLRPRQRDDRAHAARRARERRRRHGPPVRGRAGGPDPDHQQGRDAALDARSSTSTRASRAAASRDSWASPSTRRTGRTGASTSTTRTRAGSLVIAEYRRSSANANRASTTERRLLRIAHPNQANHNGGQLAFGPDGYLYIGTGDGGGSGDPDENGQKRTTLLGKILRIAPNVTSSTPAYRIPSTNPWAKSTTIRREIWAYGLRNPWRFSFDRATGSLWIADVGQDTYEEVDRALPRRPAAGGARTTGGTQCEGVRLLRAGHRLHHDRQDVRRSRSTRTARTAAPSPAATSTAAAATRRCAGRYLFGDYCAGRIWAVAAGGAARQKPVLLRDTSLADQRLRRGRGRRAVRRRLRRRLASTASAGT